VNFIGLPANRFGGGGWVMGGEKCEFDTFFGHFHANIKMCIGVCFFLYRRINGGVVVKWWKKLIIVKF
jgi:hypothetical protein